MGMAIDTVAFSATNPGAGGANAAAVSGDSLQVRAFAPNSKAYLDFLVRQGATAGFISLRSPLLHDPVRGLQFFESETPAVELLPQFTSQPVRSADLFTAVLSGGAAEVDGGIMGIYYADLPGAAARLHTWDELSGLVRNLKPVQVAVTTSGTAMAWADTVLTTTENLLKADTWYAVLGYTTDTAVAAVGIRAPETANLRVAGPGATSTLRTDDYFILMSQRHQRPYVPVFNANNRAAVFCSVSAVATAAAVNVELVLAELDQSFGG